jgi:GAF domain-containing protein
MGGNETMADQASDCTDHSEDESDSSEQGGAKSPQEKSYPMPKNEKFRMALLDAHHILNTPSDAAFDRITEMAALDFETDIALVSLVADDHQWFKSHYGLGVTSTSRDVSFCTYLVANPEMGVLEVPDATKDSRFHNNGLVTGPPGIRYYAGAPIILDEA